MAKYVAMKKILFIFLLLPLYSPAQVILTVAGTGVYGYSGEGGPATAAYLAHPEGVALDNSGNLYICDNTCVRKVSPAIGGIITTFAGVGSSPGYSGDGGYANGARINGVHDVAVDKHGNVYLADAGNNRIRKVTTDGFINTIAGTGTPGYNGDGILATTAQLNSPYGVAVDDTGNIYIADSYNRRIRKVSTSGIITTVSGTGARGHSGDGGVAEVATLYNPLALEFDKGGNLYFTDSTRIRKIDIVGIISTVAGTATFGYSGDGGLATLAEIEPIAIALDTNGSLYIADGSNKRVRKITVEGTIITIAGTGIGAYNGDGIHPLLANIRANGLIASKEGDIYIGDVTNNRVRMISYTLGQADKYIATEPGMRITPNPCSNNCTMSIQAPMSEGAEISIIDITGKEVYTAMLPGGAAKVTIEVGDWAKGTYLVQVTNKGERVLVEKVVIQ
jgi:trimeric autotransporter adhesin